MARKVTAKQLEIRTAKAAKATKAARLEPLLDTRSEAAFRRLLVANRIGEPYRTRGLRDAYRDPLDEGDNLGLSPDC
jgi:CO/xanthine dehydrogenase FAD-binding subunit